METVTLTSGRARAEIRLLGGEMLSYRDGLGRERMWSGDPAVWDGHAPVLFPIVCRLTGGQTRIGGRIYRIPMHGFAMGRPFSVEALGKDYVRLLLKATAETKEMYPFDFALRVLYTIRENGFSAEFQVENLSDRVMPFCIGGHPAFRCPMEEGEAFSDYQLVFDEIEDGENALVLPRGLVTGLTRLDFFHNTKVLPLDRRYFDDYDTLVLTNLKSRGVKLINPRTGRGLRFDYGSFPVLGVWSMPGKQGGYVCLEPWQGMPGWETESGNMEDKPHAVLLPPGLKHQTGYAMACIG